MRALRPTPNLCSARGAPRAAPRSRSAGLTCRADSVLIANTKGGGHAFIGLHLARKLLDKGHSVTILNDGDEVGRGGWGGRGRGRAMPRAARLGAWGRASPAPPSMRGFKASAARLGGGGGGAAAPGAHRPRLYHRRKAAWARAGAGLGAGPAPSTPPPTHACPLPSPQAKLRSKAPYSEYAALEAAGAKVVFGDPASPAESLADPSQFDVVYDNNGKDLEACQPLIDAVKVGGRGGRECGVG